MLNKLKIKSKLLATFIMVSLIPLGLVAFIAIDKASQALEDEAAAKFTAVQEIKRNHIEDYFMRVQTAMKIINKDPFLHQCLPAFDNAFKENSHSADNENWQIIADFKGPRIQEIVADKGFHDLLLISPDGNIVYKIAKESDLGMNIASKELTDSSLGRAFKKMADAADDDVAISDFAAYAPSGGVQAAFMMARMKNEYGDIVGQVAIQLTADQINAIVQQRSGMGETGESYLVGKVDGKTSLRSDRVVKPGKIGDATSNPFIELALSGQSGSATRISSTGTKEFVRYDPINISGLNWGLMTTISTDEVFSAVDSLRNTIFVLILVVTVAVVGLALGVTTVIIKPINGTVVMLKDIAQGEGDLTKRLKVATNDEMGQMATWFNTFMEKLQGIIREIADDASTLKDASAGLSSIAGQMTDGVENMSHRSEQVAAASKKMSSTMNGVASVSDQAATNVNMVASATEEMTATVNEIAQNSEKARAITESAVSKASDASDKVDELGAAAHEISKVTEVITEISDQTNLLALNATIEAARAGEAGKGFAVVANEIKELAKQTAAATMEIKNRIQGIQGSTNDTVTQIEEISGVINGVNEIVASIATAVEEQSVTSQEIAGNVAQASQGIADVNASVNQSSTVSAAISDDITRVNTSVQEVAGSSSQVSLNAEELAALADKLQHMVGQFKI